MGRGGGYKNGKGGGVYKMVRGRQVKFYRSIKEGRKSYSHAEGGMGGGGFTKSVGVVCVLKA